MEVKEINIYQILHINIYGHIYMYVIYVCIWSCHGDKQIPAMKELEFDQYFLTPDSVHNPIFSCDSL